MPKTGRENRSHVATRLGAACVSGCLLLAAVTGALQRLSSAADGGSVAALDVVFNEIAWMGTGADYRDEWIELHNNTTHDIDLSGWSIAAEDGTPAISLTGAISASGYYLLERGDDDTVTDVPANLIYTGALENDPAAESLALLDADGQVVDTANASGGPATELALLGSAPAARSSLTRSPAPARQARWRAVQPSSLAPSAAIPAESSRRPMSLSPALAA